MIFDDVYTMLRTIVDVPGPFPAKWRHSFTRGERGPPLWWYDESFHPSRPLASLVNGHNLDLVPFQKEPFLKLLQGMLAYEPTSVSEGDYKEHVVFGVLPGS